MPPLSLDAASRALLRVVDPSTQFPSRSEIKLIQDVDNNRAPRLMASMTQDTAQERIADNERETFRAIDRAILALRSDWDLQAVSSQTFVTRQVMETVRTASAMHSLFGAGFQPLGRLSKTGYGSNSACNSSKAVEFSTIHNFGRNKN